MPERHKYYIIEAEVMPEVFKRVVLAKQLLAQGKAKSLSAAAQMADISRSALYKYKDTVFPYLGVSTQQITTIYAALLDEPGVLSALLGALGASGANILTINQNIPVDGVAPVSVSMRTDKLTVELTELMSSLQQLEGVVEVRFLAN